MTERYRLRMYARGNWQNPTPKVERECLFDEVVEGYMTDWIAWTNRRDGSNCPPLENDYPCLAVTDRGDTDDCGSFGDQNNDGGRLILSGMALPLLDEINVYGGFAIEWERVE